MKYQKEKNFMTNLFIGIAQQHKTEILMYEFLKNEKFVPKVYFSAYSDEQYTLLLEDLVSKGG